MSDIETELRCRSCGQSVGAFHNNPCHYGNLASPYVIGSQCAELRSPRPMVENLHVKWRVGAENGHGLVGILTEGKWGSENTPVILLGPIDLKLARHIVELHNRTL